MRLTKCFALAIALTASGVHASSAGEPIVTVTACDQVELNGHVDLRFTFQVHNTSAGGVQQFFLEKLDPQGDPADTCSFVASAVPPNWQTHVFPTHVDYVGFDGIDPGASVGGFQIVLTRACCLKGIFANSIVTVAEETVCLQCATPAERATWGRMKSVYR
jgi:hypothetical protein